MKHSKQNCLSRLFLSSFKKWFSHSDRRRSQRWGGLGGVRILTFWFAILWLSTEVQPEQGHAPIFNLSPTSVSPQWKEWRKAAFHITSFWRVPVWCCPALSPWVVSRHLSTWLTISPLFFSSVFQNNQDNQTTQTSKETQTSSPHQTVCEQAGPVRTRWMREVVWHTCAYTQSHKCTRILYAPYIQASVCACVSQQSWSKFIMVRRADGTVLWGLCWDCGGPLINHTDVIGRWEPHGRCRAERWPHALSPLWLTPDRDGAKERRRDGEWEKSEEGRGGGGAWREMDGRGCRFTHP